MSIKTNECAMCGMSIPEDETLCARCKQEDSEYWTRAFSVFDDMDSTIADVENAMYEAEDGEPACSKHDECDACGITGCAYYHND